MSDWVFHGGRIDTARTAYPDAPQPWLDLSTGINPVPWRGLEIASIGLGSLPDVSALAELEAAAGSQFGVRGAAIATLPGSELGLRMIGELGLPAPHHVLAPGYRTHAAAFPHAAPVGFDGLRLATDGGGTLLLANPGNPDGRVMPADAMVELADRLASRRGWLVVDEAFADAVPNASVVPSVASRDNILVLRSFGKFFGLAGLRLGFLVGAPAMVGRMRDRLGSWPVSSLAIAIGRAAYRDASWIADTRVRLARDARAFDHTLAAHGLVPRGDCPLFRLVETPAAATMFERLARMGILTRPFEYAPDWLRFGVPSDAAALARLDRALRGE